MPISEDLIRPRLREIGRIRLGQKVPMKNGKMRPDKLESLRFTSRDGQLIESVAALYGGEVEPWEQDGAQWQVVTEATAIPVVLPQADMSFSQAMELWSGGGCVRRCDGQREVLSDGPCLCDPDERECKPHTRLSLMLPDLPGLGLWRLDTQGWHAGAELLGAMKLASLYGADLIPARLVLDKRTSKRLVNGKSETLRYVVPCLSLDVSQQELVEVARTRALGVGPARLGLPSVDPDEPVDPRDDLLRSLHAKYRERYPKHPRLSDEEYRQCRLEWSAEILGRHSVLSWNGPENPNELTRADVQRLHAELDRLQIASEEHPAPEAQAGPVSPSDAGPADSSAGEATGVEPGARVITGSSTSAPAGPNVAAGGDVREVTGQAGAVTPDLPTAAPAPARPRKPNLAEESKKVQAIGKHTEIEREQTPIQAMIPSFRNPYLTHFGEDRAQAALIVEEHIDQWKVQGKWPAEGKFAPWSKELYLELAADTFDKEKYR